MTEEIIIDGVNVAGCGYYDAKNDKGSWCDLTCTQEHSPFFRCESMPYCNYKQLKRLEQENKELREMLSEEPKAMQAFQTAYSSNKKENEILWGMVKDYKSALEKIREILNKNCGVISNAKAVGIINEVLK